MIWNYSECYNKYKEVFEYLKNSLGISDLHLYMNRTELLPYQTQIIQYLNNRLIESGLTEIKFKVELILDIFEKGADKICDLKGNDLADDIGIDTDYSLYKSDRFIFTWTNVMSNLCLLLKLMYGYLFAQDTDTDCCKCCSKGQTVEDYESWVSNVNPEDEEYDWTNYYRTNSNWGTTDNRYCNCYRLSSETSNDSNSENSEINLS